MQVTTTNYTDCPACHAVWREIEKKIQACLSCLFMSMPLPADTVDIDN